MCAQPEYHECAEEWKDALNIVNDIKKSLEKEQDGAQEIEKNVDAFLAHLQVSTTEMSDKEPNNFSLFGSLKKWFTGSDATAEKEKTIRFAEQVKEGLKQMQMETIKCTQTHVEKLLKSDLFKGTNASKDETHNPAQHIPDMKLCVPDISDKNITKSKIPVTSLLYCPQKSELVKYVVEGLDEMLRNHLITYNIDLDMKFRESVQEIPENIPLIVICLHASRLGTDVSNAVKGIRTGPHVAVIVLHHKDIHALPFQRSNKILTAPEFQTIGAILDMGFLSQKGFYPCDINQNAIEALTSFIRRTSCV